MVINFLGDSITQGAGASAPEKNYVSLVGELLPCEAKNYGVGGTRIARQTVPSEEEIYDQDFLLRSEQMGDADFVFVFGGTNDFGHGDAELGSVLSRDIYTFCGAVNVLFESLTSRYGKEKLCVILPLHRFDEENPYGEGNKMLEGPVLRGYSMALEALARIHGIDVLSFEEEFPTPKTNAGDDLTVDGLHPNDKGHRLLAEGICGYLREKFGL